ncbi:SDR family NAD(P)-dependent oxidoreductase [Adhaeretor mobilis]|uniref:3-oxoacyl-[acyl-carrier-protein] reductase FabG n=1 Tax=Adhaeretor mobilis TaxID=1930276 RepID=A0A517MYG0_9BACT|nr:3-oxoacyl-ACP reductase family protein [Adhaeretor mobilis]QDS99922.1 3-oxoacyl-[acyl-carrier-protein] reductase FabG [Adhaeretor mobilis]
MAEIAPNPAGSTFDHLSLEGRVALVTGSTTGLGKAMARSLAKAGARVAINYANNQRRAEQTLTEFREAGLQVELFRASVIDPEEVQRLADEVRDALGPIDIVVISATPEQPLKPIEEYDWEFYAQLLDFFVKSPFLLAQTLLPHMKEQQWGRIINIGSEVFHQAWPNFSAYAAAKGAQHGWTRSLATELAADGITVNMVSPGWIPVERHEKDPQEDKDEYLTKVPAGRFGVPDDLAGLISFLAGESSSFITGQDILVNGGKIAP